MVEFKINLEESIVKAIGKEEIEKSLEEITSQIILKLAAKDILSDLSTFDLSNDMAWQSARNLAWKEEQHKYLEIHKK